MSRSPAPPLRTSGLIALIAALALLAGACGGSEADEPAAAEPAATPSADADTSPGGDRATPSEETTGPTAEATIPAETEAAVQSEAPAAGAAVEGCPDGTELGITMVRTDGEEEILPPTTFSGGHFVLDLDGSGFGPTLGGVLTTDAAADPVALGEAWASPESPAEGQLHITVLLQGPPAGATAFPPGVYGVTFSDTSFAPTEGMGLAALERRNPDGSSNPMNRDNQLELTHVGDGTVCGTITPTGREPAQSNPVTEVVGSFVATLAEQP